MIREIPRELERAGRRGCGATSHRDSSTMRTPAARWVTDRAGLTTYGASMKRTTTPRVKHVKPPRTLDERRLSTVIGGDSLDGAPSNVVTDYSPDSDRVVHVA